MAAGTPRILTLRSGTILIENITIMPCSLLPCFFSKLVERLFKENLWYQNNLLNPQKNYKMKNPLAFVGRQDHQMPETPTSLMEIDLKKHPEYTRGLPTHR